MPLLVSGTWGRVRLRYIILCVLGLFSTPTLADKNVVLSVDDEVQPISPYVRVLKDPKGEINAETALKILSEVPANNANQIPLSIDGGSYWLKFSIENPTSEQTLRIFMLDYFLINNADLYAIKNGRPEFKSNVDISKSVFQRDIAFRVPSFQIEVPHETVSEYLVRISLAGKSSHALELKPKLMSVSAFVKHQLSFNLVFACLIGILFSLAIYNTIVFIRVGVAGHIYYSLYLYSYIVVIFCYEGLFLYLPRPPSPNQIVLCMSVIPIFAGVSLIEFGRNVLDLRRFSPRLNTCYRVAPVVFLILLPFAMFEVGRVGYYLELLVVLFTILLGVIATIMPAKEFRAARYFAISFIFIGVGYGVETTLYSTPTGEWAFFKQRPGLISWIEQYFFYCCVVIEMFFLALALASYIDKLRYDRKQSRVNEMRQLEETSRIKSEYASSLEKTVSERTKEVIKQREMLAEKNKKLLEVDGMKSQFIANISHEIRTPVTLIDGPLKKVVSGDYGQLNGDVESALNVSIRNVSRLAKLIEELLMLSRLEEDNLKLRVGMYEIGSFCRRVTSMFEHKAQERNIELEIQSPELPVPVFFDKDKLESVLCNLLSNALKYTPVGGAVNMSISADHLDGDAVQGNFVEISIRDTGPGIPVDQHAQIFDRFYRLEQDSNGSVEGSGIGLALVKELVEAHGGEVSINSEGTDGSEFVVRLPMGFAHFSETEILEEPEPEAELDRLEPSSVGIPKPERELNSPKKKTLLLVEDIFDMCEYIAGHFRRDYNVIEAKEGVEALEKLSEHHVDIVVSDIMMPGMDGLSLLGEIRANAAYKNLPVILLTARASIDDKNMALNAQADDYLAKPFDSDELVLKVKNLLARIQTESASPSIADAEQANNNQVTPSADELFLEKARSAVNESIGDSNYDVNALAKSLHMSKATLHRQIDKAAQTTPAAFMRDIRLRQAHIYIESKRYRTIAEVAHAVGFSNAGYFSRLYKNSQL